MMSWSPLLRRSGAPIRSVKRRRKDSKTATQSVALERTRRSASGNLRRILLRKKTVLPSIQNRPAVQEDLGQVEPRASPESRRMRPLRVSLRPYKMRGSVRSFASAAVWITTCGNSVGRKSLCPRQERRPRRRQNPPKATRTRRNRRLHRQAQ